MEDDDLDERFLKANANVDNMAYQLADCLRNCMRAVASVDPSLARYRAARDFEIFLKLLVRSEGIRLHELFEKTIEQIRSPEPDFGGEWSAYQHYEDSIVAAAEKGLQFLIERSCSDPAAAGRASRRRSEFLNCIKQIEDARQEMVREANERWQSTRGLPVRRTRKPPKTS